MVQTLSNNGQLGAHAETEIKKSLSLPNIKARTISARSFVRPDRCVPPVRGSNIAFAQSLRTPLTEALREARRRTVLERTKPEQILTPHCKTT
jgi:hypothetical protein